MGGSDNYAYGILALAVIIFIVVFVLLMYYAYSGQSGNDSSSNDCDDNGTINTCNNNGWPNFNINKNINNKKTKNRSPTSNLDEFTSNIRDGLNQFDRIVREPFIANGRPTTSINQSKDCDDSLNNRVATRLDRDTTIDNNTRNGKLFIIESSCSIDVRLPRREGLSLKFWNNSTTTQNLIGHVPIFDENNSSRTFTLQVGQFLILESVGDLWLITTKTKSDCDIKPSRPCKNNPSEQCDISDSLGSEINDLLNGGWPV